MEIIINDITLNPLLTLAGIWFFVCACIYLGKD